MACFEEIVPYSSAPPNRIALLLAGGDGMRLQELTRKIAGIPIPKQYCRLLNDSSLLEATLIRALLFTSRDRVSIIFNQNHLRWALDQTCGLAPSNVFIQPVNRDTGPGIIFSLLRLEHNHPDSIVAVFPTDHYVDNGRRFIAHVQRAADIVSRMPGKITILGVTPDRPETGYGYILPSAPVESFEKAYHVEAFAEKPSLTSARHIISFGGLWNTFVMVFKLSRMLELLEKSVPEEFGELSGLRQSPEKAAELYENLGAWNFSSRVLARIPQHLVVLEVSGVQWSDWGTRESVERTYRELNLVPFWNTSDRVAESRARG